MEIRSLSPLEMLLLASAFSNALTHLPTSALGNRPAENALPDLSTAAVVPGSWAYEEFSQPYEKIRLS